MPINSHARLTLSPKRSVIAFTAFRFALGWRSFLSRHISMPVYLTPGPLLSALISGFHVLRTSVSAFRLFPYRRTWLSSCRTLRR